MIQLAAYPTGRPVFLDPHRVSAVLDLIEAQPAQLQGGPPRVAIVGTLAIVDGAPVHLAGSVDDNAPPILAARKPVSFLGQP